MIIRDRNEVDNKSILCMTSIGGSPFHEGHIRCLLDCKRRVLEASGLSIEKLRLLVLINCNDFLVRKHQFVFQDEEARAEIIDAVKTVDYTFIHQSDKQDIADAIHYFQPHFFLKGGDRSTPDSLPSVELEACKDYGVNVLFGVGGSEKVCSSSDLLKKTANHYLFKKFADDWVDNIEKLVQGEYPEFRSMYRNEL